MELDENFSIRQSGDNVILVELVDSMSKPKDKKEKPKPIKSEKLHNYGTIYQALWGYLHYSTNHVTSMEDLSGVRKKAIKVMDTLDKFEKEIKEKFRC